MLFDLNKLHGHREHVERIFQPVTFDPQDDEYRVAAPVELSMDVQNVADAVFGVTGRLSTRLGVECSRCLEAFEVPIDARFDLRYVPHADNTGEREREVGEGDLATAYYREGMLDLIELMREQFVLALPMKPLCTEACRGLCAHCGTNLNKTQCDCAPAWEDPRLAPLKTLLTQDTEN
ncbi:MAG: YceD family protein [Vicinamibacterales bacterium]